MGSFSSPRKLVMMSLQQLQGKKRPFINNSMADKGHQKEEKTHTGHLSLRHEQNQSLHNTASSPHAPPCTNGCRGESGALCVNHFLALSSYNLQKLIRSFPGGCQGPRSPIWQSMMSTPAHLGSAPQCCCQGRSSNAGSCQPQAVCSLAGGLQGPFLAT